MHYKTPYVFDWESGSRSRWRNCKKTWPSLHNRKHSTQRTRGPQTIRTAQAFKASATGVPFFNRPHAAAVARGNCEVIAAAQFTAANHQCKGRVPQLTEDGQGLGIALESPHEQQPFVIRQALHAARAIVQWPDPRSAPRSYAASQTLVHPWHGFSRLAYLWIVRIAMAGADRLRDGMASVQPVMVHQSPDSRTSTDSICRT
jgi:hypothetical protein